MFLLHKCKDDSRILEEHNACRETAEAHVTGRCDISEKHNLPWTFTVDLLAEGSVTQEQLMLHLPFLYGPHTTNQFHALQSEYQENRKVHIHL